MKLSQLKETTRPAFPKWTIDEESMIAVCNGFNIRTLKGVPFDKLDHETLDNFQDISVDISDNGLTDLEGFPVFNSYQSVDMSHNKLTSCKGLPRTFDTLWAKDNQIKSVKEDILPYIDALKWIDLSGNPVEKSGLLSLFELDGLRDITLSENGVQEIIKKHLKRRGESVRARMLDCQDDLIEAGYDAQAKL
jgi:hypothetical protein